MNQRELKRRLEAVLFVSPKPLGLKELADISGAKADEAKQSLLEIIASINREDSGLRLLENSGKYQLATAPEEAETIRVFLKDEASGELSQPSLEALTIIAYRGPVTKLDLERIRGVNCSLIIRNLLIRGLIEESFDKKKNESYYSVSMEFLRHLGLVSLSQLPDYERLRHNETLEAYLAKATEMKEEGRDE